MFNLFNIIISFGALQGFIVGLWLLSNSLRKNPTKRFLSLLLLGLAFILVRITVIDIYEADSLPPLHLNFIFLIAPSLYFYVRSLVDDIETNEPQKIWHFAPFVIINIGYSIFYLVAHNINSYQDNLHSVIAFDEVLSLVYFAFYILLTHRFFKKKSFILTQQQSGWIKKLLLFHLAFLIIWFAYLIAELFFFHYSMEVNTYYPMMILLSGILYYISLQVLNAKQILFETKTVTARKNHVLNKVESADLLTELNSVMESKQPFLDGELSLTSLAQILNIQPKTLSFLINEHVQKNFNDYINDWRIVEVKKRLIAREYAHLKILSIAFDCGFNSKSTFNLAFKKATGLSPSAFRQTA